MAATPSTEPARDGGDSPWDARSIQGMLTVAVGSLDHGLSVGAALPVSPPDHPAPLQALRASFVTLKRDGQLRGCIGSLEAARSLVEDVAANAYGAGFRDPRFPPLTRDELAGLGVSISVLSPAEPLTVQDEQELLATLEPGVDGLIVEDGGRRATFLPTVWESLTEPQAFVRALKQKAGLPPEHWSNSLRWARYATHTVSCEDAAAYISGNRC